MAMMKAAVLHGLNDLRIEDVPVPSFGENDVLVRVTYNGLCGTDASEYAKGQIMVPLAKPHPGSKHQGPTVMGHEFIGEVIDAGANVKNMIGKRIACGAGVSCGECKYCKAGRTNLCTGYYTLGLSIHGGMAEFAVAPANICVPIPDSLPDLQAALAQPLAVGIHSVRRSGIKAGDKVVLLGFGAIGAFVCVGLLNKRVEIVAMDVEQKRLDVAKKLGATETVLINKETTPAELKEMFPSGGDVVFETSGAPGAPARALAITRTGGTTMMLGLNKIPQEISMADTVLREITIATSVAHVCKDDIPEALELIKNKEIADLLTDRVFNLTDSDTAFKELAAGKANGKILITPRAEL
jgi:(R,R)-butanediol dehydrogenase/meso-butanediol dehydrogenase/diacetyl reductase